MKLYSTIVSNRAMKSQGGDWLKIIIRDEKQHCISYIKVSPETCDKRAMIDIDMLNTADINIDKVVQIYTDDDTKGERQKGEKHDCDKHLWHCEGEGCYPCPHCN